MSEECQREFAPRSLERSRKRDGGDSSWWIVKVVRKVLSYVPGSAMLGQLIFGVQKPRRRRRKQRKSQKTLIRKLVSHLPHNQQGGLRYFASKKVTDGALRHPVGRVGARRKRSGGRTSSVSHDEAHECNIATLRDLAQPDSLNSLSALYVAAPVASVPEEDEWEDTNEVVEGEGEGSGGDGDVSDEMAQLFAQIEKLTVCIPDTPLVAPLSTHPPAAAAADSHSETDRDRERELMEQKAAQDLAAMMAGLFSRTSAMVS